MRRPFKIALVAAIVLALGGAVIFAQMLRSGFSTHEDPSAFEALAARSMRSWATPSDLRGAGNPLPQSPEVLASGRSHWADHCATCHGNDGKGQTTLGKGMYPRAPDMSLEATQDLSDGELFAIIENGIRLTGMPGWGNGTAESAYGTWGLVHFIRHLPKVTADEIAEMEALNPKSPAEWEQMRAEQEFLRGSSTPPPAASHDATPHGH